MQGLVFPTNTWKANSKETDPIYWNILFIHDDFMQSVPLYVQLVMKLLMVVPRDEFDS